MSNLIMEAAYLLGEHSDALLALALTWLTTKIAGLVKNQALSNIITRIDDAAMKVVRDVFAAWVEPRKKAGEWNESSKAEGKKKALAELKDFLGAKGLAELLKLLGGNAIAVENYLGASIENAITASKNEAAMVSRLDSGKKPST